MRVLGNILYLNTRHGAIMALQTPERKRAVLGTSGMAGHCVARRR
jgi:hypothetical protein